MNTHHQIAGYTSDNGCQLRTNVHVQLKCTHYTYHYTYIAHTNPHTYKHTHTHKHTHICSSLSLSLSLSLSSAHPSPSCGGLMSNLLCKSGFHFLQIMLGLRERLLSSGQLGVQQAVFCCQCLHLLVLCLKLQQSRQCCLQELVKGTLSVATPTKIYCVHAYITHIQVHSCIDEQTNRCNCMCNCLY